SKSIAPILTDERYLLGRDHHLEGTSGPRRAQRQPDVPHARIYAWAARGERAGPPPRLHQLPAAVRRAGATVLRARLERRHPTLPATRLHRPPQRLDLGPARR